MNRYDLKKEGEMYVMRSNANGRYVRHDEARHVEKKVDGLQRQLAEVTKERDQLRAMLNLADALRNKERSSK